MTLAKLSLKIVSDERVARLVSELTGRGYVPPYTCMGIELDDRITGGIIFNVFEGTGVHATVAGSGWTRSFLKAAGVYAFSQLGCLRVTITTEQPEVVDLSLRLGGQIEGVMRNQFGKGRDGIIVGILKEEYRFT